MNKYVELGTICSLQNGRAFKPDEWSNDGAPIVRIQNLNDDSKEFNYCNFDVDEKFHIKSGDLLFSWSGTPGTSFGAFFWNRGFAVLNQHIFRVDVDEAVINKKYLRYSLNSQINNIIEQAHGGVGLKHITKGRLESILVPLPPLEEQKRIAAILDKADFIRQKRQRAIELADEFLRSVFLDMFGDPVTNPKGWEISELGDCCSLQGGYAFKSEDFSKTGIPLVKITNVHFENIDWSDRDFVPVVFLEQKSDFSLKDGDLIMAMTRPVIKALNAVKVIEVKKQDLPCLLNQRVGRFKGFEKNFEKDFFKCFLYSSYFKNEVEKLCSVALQPNVSSKQIESIKCFIPPKDLQRKFSVIKQNVDKIISSFIPFSNMPLFESLSKKAFSGQL